MKIKHRVILLLIFLCFGSVATAQIELPESTKKGLEKYNKQQEEKNPKEDEKDDKTKELEEAWAKKWKDQMESFKEVSSYFSTKELNCMFLIVLYVDGYLSLADYANKEKNCLIKYDLLGIQASALAMSTMIYYCPEYIAGLTQSEVQELIVRPLRDLDNLEPKPVGLLRFFAVLRKLALYLDTNDYGVLLPKFIGYFQPEYIVSKSLSIANEMEALGCGDY